MDKPWSQQCREFFNWIDEELPESSLQERKALIDENEPDDWWTRSQYQKRLYRHLRAEYLRKFNKDGTRKPAEQKLVEVGITPLEEFIERIV